MFAQSAHRKLAAPKKRGKKKFSVSVINGRINITSGLCKRDSSKKPANVY